MATTTTTTTATIIPSSKPGVTVVHHPQGRNESFEPGSLFASCFESNLHGRDFVSVHVHAGTSLTINLVTSAAGSGSSSLSYKTPDAKEWMHLLFFGSGKCNITGLNLTVRGPKELQFKVEQPSPTYNRRILNLFGTIHNEQEHQQMNPFQKQEIDDDDSNNENHELAAMEQEELTAQQSSMATTKKHSKNKKTLSTKDRPEDRENGDSGAQPTSFKSQQAAVAEGADQGSTTNGKKTAPIKGKKRKARHDEEEENKVTITTNALPSVNDNGDDEYHKPSHNDLQQQQPLNKRQRRKLAQQKAKELADTLSAMKQQPTELVAINSPTQPTASGETKTLKPGQSTASSSSVAAATKPKAVPLTKPRRLAGGLLVQDFLLGNGALVKTGHNVAIIYEGRFPNGDVFDKNKNRQRPLVFRPGTGQVVPGLDQGLEGMRVGGKRDITIPPQLGYGAKGSAPVVPPHATLIFSVEVVSVGGK